MDKIIQKILNEKYKKVVRFQIVDLENDVIEYLGGQTKYQDKGGYNEFAQSIIRMQQNHIIEPLKIKDTNNRYPKLQSKWKKIKVIQKDTWSKEQFFMVTDKLDLSYYEKHPIAQTKEQWSKIVNIYNFIKEIDSREWASIEERSLELFNNEKYITDNKDSEQAKILRKLNLTYEDIKAKKYGEFFVHYSFNKRQNNVVYIVENHSTFFSYKKLIREESNFINPLPQILIYGEGKKIVSSLSFLDELVDVEKAQIYYFGDIDKEGFGIFTSLKEKYKNINMQLDYSSYIELLKQPAFDCNQDVNDSVLQKIVSLFKGEGYEREAELIIDLWKNDKRIPQEYLNYEYIKRCPHDK